jgi:hypothetical protein
MPRATDIMPITGFTRAYQKVCRELKKHGRPTVLTVDGKPAVVVQDAAAYDKLLSLIDSLYVEMKVAEVLDNPRPGMSLDELKARLSASAKQGWKSTSRNKRHAA